MRIKNKIKNFLRIDDNCKWYYSIKYSIGSLPYYLMRVFPIKSNKVVCVSFRGKYGGDPKYVSDAIKECDGTVDLVWLLKDMNDCNDNYIRKVYYNSIKAIYELATAKIWIDDCRKEGEVRKRKSQFYIGTGHGGVPMKKIEKDAVDKLGQAYLILAKNDSKMTDLKPSNSQWRNNMLRRAFWYDGEILDCGLPRVEYLIKNKSKIKKMIHEKYKIDMDKKIFIYAPTFRNDGNMDLYNIDFERVGKALSKRFGGEWIGLRRLHPNITSYSRVDIPEVVIDTTAYPDMEDLIMASDLLITDYSSCIFETFFLEIPAFIYATDIKKYTERERGLYWDIEKLPFLIATNNDDLIEKISLYNPLQYEEGLYKLKNELGFFEDQTHAIENIVDRIFEEMKK